MARPPSYVRVRGAASGIDDADRIGELARALRVSRAYEAALDHTPRTQRANRNEAPRRRRDRDLIAE